MLFWALSIQLAVFLLPSTGYAQQGLSAPADKLNIVLLLDSSASMLVNDPSKLRIEGSRLMLQFLKSGDNLSIVSFDSEAKVLRPLSPFSSEQIPQIMSSLNSVEASGQYTDLNAGLLKAIELLKSAAVEDRKPVIVLLSDGKMDPSPARGTSESHLDSLSTTILPGLKNNAFSVYTLSFSQDADRALLQHIAQATDGVNWFTPDSGTIHESFADLFLSLKKPQVVAHSAKGFKIETNIEEATFYVNQPEGVKIKLESPDEEEFTADELPDYIRWFEGKKFSVITISQPIAGDWKLIGVNPDEGFATILTNLKLVTDWPNAIPVDEKVTLKARLYEGKLPVDLQAISEAVTFAFQVTPSDRVSEPIIREFLGDKGEGGDEKAADGVFSHEFKISDAGEYRLRILAKGPTFERQLQIPFRVRPPLVNIEVSDPATGLIEETHDQSESDKKDNHNQSANKQKTDKIVPPETDHNHSDSHASDNKHSSKGKAIINGSNQAIFEINLNEEATTFKDVKVNIVAVDKKHNKYTIQASTAGHQEVHEKADKDSESHKAEDGHKADVHSQHKDSSLLYLASAEALPADGLYEIKAYLKAKSRDGKEIEEESEPLKFNRKTIVELVSKQVEPKQKEPEHKEPEVVKKSVIDLVSLILVTIVNLGLGSALFLLLKKGQAMTSASADFQLPEISPEILAKIAEIEKLAQIDSVDLNDPRFKESAPKSKEAGIKDRPEEAEVSQQEPQENDSEVGG